MSITEYTMVTNTPLLFVYSVILIITRFINDHSILSNTQYNNGVLMTILYSVILIIRTVY
jgi:hypothetical protein